MVQIQAQHDVQPISTTKKNKKNITISGHLGPLFTPMANVAPFHMQLPKGEATTFRRLQTNTYPHRTLPHATYLTDYQATSNYCSLLGTLYHQLWQCWRRPGVQNTSNHSIQQRAARLGSKDHTIQLRLVNMARTSSKSQKIPD